MHPLIALRAFFAVLFSKHTAIRVRDFLDQKSSNKLETASVKPKKTEEVKAVPAPAPSTTKGKGTDRNGALTLLSTLQREARMLDLVFESLDNYSDAQVGAAARDVLRDSRKTLERVFGLKPLVDSSEGERIELPDQASPVRWRLIGNSGAKSGTLSHRGWQASRVDVPQWSGGSEDAMVVAAAEVEA